MATDITPGLRWSARPTARQPTSHPADHKQPATYRTPRAHSPVSIATERLCASQRLAGDVESGGVWITETVQRQTQMWCRVGSCVYILGAQPRALCRVWRPVSTENIRPHCLSGGETPDPTAPGSTEPEHLHNSDTLTEPGCSDWSGKLITSNVTGVESSRTLTLVFQFVVLHFRGKYDTFFTALGLNQSWRDFPVNFWGSKYHDFGSKSQSASFWTAGSFRRGPAVT